MNVKQKMSYKMIIFVMGIFLIAIGSLIKVNVFQASKGSVEAISPSLDFDDSNEIVAFNEDYVVDVNFSSHLPIVVINCDENDLIKHTYLDKESGTYQTLMNPNDAFTHCEIEIYDNGIENVLSNKPTITTNANIRYRGNSSMEYAKKQYLIKLLDENGNNSDIDIMGMGKDNTWVLNGSLIDKSMIRNYLAYTISSQILEASADAEFCEMFFLHNNEYEYMGVYLMTETAKRGDSRLPLRKYNPRYTQTDYILRRDRYDEWSVSLNNHASENKLCYGTLAVKYPSDEEITEDTVKYIEDEISQFEKALYSNDPNVFVTYRDYIDMDSFVDYFIINEFFGNYDAGNNSTYMYKRAGGKLTMGPVWDFDGAVDNYRNAPFDYDAIAFQESPWFDRMLLDPEFCQRLIFRYEELRKGVLSDEYITDFIDTIVAYLGKAQQREWARWGKHYINSDRLNDGMDRHGVMHTNRNLNSYEEEINKIKTVITKHGEWLDQNTEVFYLNANTVPGLESSVIAEIDDNNQVDFNYGALFAVIFVGIFFTSIIMTQRMN